MSAAGGTGAGSERGCEKCTWRWGLSTLGYGRNDVQGWQLGDEAGGGGG